MKRVIERVSKFFIAQAEDSEFLDRKSNARPHTRRTDPAPVGKRPHFELSLTCHSPEQYRHYVRTRFATWTPQLVACLFAPLFLGQTAFAEESSELRQLTVAVSVPGAKKACARPLPRIIAEELERFGVRSIYGKTVASARRQARARGMNASALAETGRLLDTEYVLHVKAEGSRGSCKASAVLVESWSGRVQWTFETRFSARAAEGPVRRLAGRAMLDLFGKKPVRRSEPIAEAPKKAAEDSQSETSGEEPGEPDEADEPEHAAAADRATANDRAPKTAERGESAVHFAKETPAPAIFATHNRAATSPASADLRPRAIVVPKDEVDEPLALSASAESIADAPIAEDSGESTSSSSTLDAPSELQLRGLLSVANTLERQPALERIDFKRKRGQGFAVFRGMARIEPSSHAELEAHVLQTLSIASGDYGPFTAAYSDRSMEANRFAGLNYAWADSENANANIIVDRLKLHLSFANVDIALGRQPINLATTYYFSPNDFFVPFAADTVYRGYKPGVDSGRIDVQLGELSTLSLIGVLGYQRDALAEPAAKDPVTWDRSALLLTSSFSVETFHIGAIAGKIPSALAIGGSVEGEVGEWLGIRAEGHFAIPSGERRNRLELAVTLEHRFENSLHLRLEHFFHGGGRSRKEAFGSAHEDRLGPIPFLSKNLTAFGVGYEITPMLKADALAMLSFSDFSGAASLSMTYSIFENGELAASARAPWGEPPDSVLDESGYIYATPVSEFGFSQLAANLDFRIFF